jgi:NAD(P)-dependent dehydrogenase (short-subunit alcohol dehydrogenase family)
MGASSSSYSAPAPIASKYFADFEKALPRLDGKVVIVTGCTTGTGFVAARTCAKLGAHVLMLNRPSDRATSAHAQVSSFGTATSIPCDLGSLSSVRSAIAEVNKICGETGVDVLCNNAGVMALEDKATGDGYDVQMQTNHLSHFLLTKELFPLLEKAAELRGEARIVQHSSGARKFPSNPLDAKYLGKNGGNLGGDGASMLFGGARWKRK